MAKKISATEYRSGDVNTSRPGIHAKTKTSNHKQSKHYKKAYRGQGK
jgi:hypothetical protein